MSDQDLYTRAFNEMLARETTPDKLFTFVSYALREGILENRELIMTTEDLDTIIELRFTTHELRKLLEGASS